MLAALTRDARFVSYNEIEEAGSIQHREQSSKFTTFEGRKVSSCRSRLTSSECGTLSGIT